jgi:hypothetical protein
MKMQKKKKKLQENHIRTPKNYDTISGTLKREERKQRRKKT